MKLSHSKVTRKPPLLDEEEGYILMFDISSFDCFLFACLSQSGRIRFTRCPVHWMYSTLKVWTSWLNCTRYTLTPCQDTDVDPRKLSHGSEYGLLVQWPSWRSAVCSPPYWLVTRQLWPGWECTQPWREGLAEFSLSATNGKAPQNRPSLGNSTTRIRHHICKLPFYVVLTSELILH